MLQVNNLTVQYGERVLFDGIAFQVNEQERIGLAGRNGAGKSTLLKILAGQQKNYDGNVQVPKGYTIGYLKQELDSESDKTVMAETATALGDLKSMKKRMDDLTEKIANHHDYQSDDYAKLIEELSDVSHRYEVLGADKAEMQIEKVLLGLGFQREHLDQPLNTFSGGWQMRVELAKILLQQPDLLLLDEPTNHLDIESIIWLENFLQNYPGSIMLVSHDKRLLDNLTNRTIEIELGKVYDYKANYSNYLQLREERREKLMQEKKNQDKYVQHTEQLINKFRAKANKAAFAQSLIKKLDKLERIEIDDPDTAAMNIRFPDPPRAGQIVVKCEKLSKRYDDHLVLDKIDLEVERGEKIAFVGKNGEGKTTLSKIIGGFEPYDGKCELGYNVEIGFFAQHQHEMLDPQKTVLETIEDSAPDEIRPKARGILGSFLFSDDDVYKKIKILSGGEKARVSLAKLMLQPHNLLVMDEPTNHLDMISKDLLKQAIRNFKGTLIIVSHDREFMEDLTEKVYEFRDKKIHEYLGDIKYFLDKRNIGHLDDLTLGSDKKDTKKQNQPSHAKLSYEERKERDRKQRKVSNAISNKEKEIKKLEQQMKEMEAEIHQPDFYEKADHPQQKFDDYNKVKKALDQAMEKWTELQMEKEELEEAV